MSSPRIILTDVEVEVTAADEITVDPTVGGTSSISDGGVEGSQELIPGKENIGEKASYKSPSRFKSKPSFPSFIKKSAMNSESRSNTSSPARGLWKSSTNSETSRSNTSSPARGLWKATKLSLSKRKSDSKEDISSPSRKSNETKQEELSEHPPPSTLERKSPHSPSKGGDARLKVMLASEDLIVDEHFALEPKSLIDTPSSIKPWYITCTRKYSGRVSKQVTLLDDGYQLARILDEFEQGLLDEQSFAHELITALFDGDFKLPRKRWTIGLADVFREEEGEIVKIRAVKEARLNWKEYFSCAVAKGTICFFPDRQEIRVDDYNFCVAGGRFTFINW